MSEDIAYSGTAFVPCAFAGGPLVPPTARTIRHTLNTAVASLPVNQNITYFRHFFCKHLKIRICKEKKSYYITNNTNFFTLNNINLQCVFSSELLNFVPVKSFCYNVDRKMVVLQCEFSCESLDEIWNDKKTIK